VLAQHFVIFAEHHLGAPTRKPSDVATDANPDPGNAEFGCPLRSIPNFACLRPSRT
jgi:hypothetical protein